RLYRFRPAIHPRVRPCVPASRAHVWPIGPWDRVVRLLEEILALRCDRDLPVRRYYHARRQRNHDVPRRAPDARPVRRRVWGRRPGRAHAGTCERMITRSSLAEWEAEEMSAFSPIDIAAQIEGIEWVVILIIIAVLLLFGPSKLPELARGVGRALGEFRRGRMEIEREISTELSTLDARDMRMRVEKAAGALGVSAGGRSEMQLKLDIARAVDRAQDEQVVSAAQAMGVYSSGSDVIRLKEQIIKALNV